MIVGAATLGPVEEPVGFLDSKVIDTGVAHRHEPVGVELSVFIAVGTKPLATGLV